MATDFTYGEKQIVSSGPFKPSGKDMPVDARTRVECYADIASIPNPHVGLKITVKVDETNNNKMTDYIVKSLKANSMGAPNSAIDEVVRYVDYLGVSSSGGGTSAGTGEGLTTEQAQQLTTAYEHSQSVHVQASDIPSKTSDLTNDSNYATETFVTSKIAEAQLGGDEVDLSDYATKTYTDNAVSTALDGHTFKVLTQKQYDAITDKDENTIYIIDDDSAVTSLPSYSDSDANKVLSVNSDGSDLVWIDKNSIVSSFLANAIFFEDDILCTSISLNTTSLTFDSSDPQTLIATVKPGNTTQLVVWTTNNSNVATVSNGIVTPTGNGSCVITAKCGSYSATCSVTVNESVTVITYTIENKLTNVTNSNSSISITENSRYTATLSPSEEYEISTVIVTMGGANITNSAYSNGTITINNVTGNIVITAVATEKSTGEVEFTPFGNFAIGQLSSPSASSLTTSYKRAVSCINTGELRSGSVIGFNDSSLYSTYKFAYGLKTGTWINSSAGAYYTENVTISGAGEYGVMITKVQGTEFTEDELSKINTSFGKLPTV